MADGIKSRRHLPLIPAWVAWSELPILLLGLTIFFALTFYQIELPGLHPDEALEVLPAVQLLRGQEVECFKGVCVHLFGLRLPVMIYEYIATVNTYLVIPFFLAFGINVPALRTMPIVTSAVAMLFLYLWSRELYGRRVASITFLLMSVNPSFVFWSRQGVFVTSITIPISMIAVWAWLKWWQYGQAHHLWLGAFLFGLGLSAKLLFWWLIAGLGGAFAILNADRLLASLRQRSLAPLHIHLRWSDAAIAALLCAIGLLPLIIFNIETQSTINYIRDNVFSSSYYNVDNTNLSENLRERVKELRSVLNGETFWYLSGRPYASWRYPSVFVIAIGVLTLSIWGSRRQSLRTLLPIWLTLAITVWIGYSAFHIIKPQNRAWYRLTLAAAPLIAALTSMVTTRLGIDKVTNTDMPNTHKSPWRLWVELTAVGVGGALATVVFYYLTWKLARWELPPFKSLYPWSLGILSFAPLLRAREQVRRVLFPPLVITVMLVGSCFTPTALWFTHLAIMTPWPVLTIVLVADLTARQLGLDRINLKLISSLRNRRRAAWLSIGLAAVLALAGILAYDDLEVDIAYHRDLKRIGGVGDHTSASYTLVRYLREHGITNTVAMDWGIQDVVQFLTAGDITPPEIFGYENREQPDPGFGIRVRHYLSDPTTVYLFHVQPHFRNRREVFEQIVAAEGKKAVEEKIIYDRAAIPIYSLVRVR